jgi:hypothetical protein
MPKASFTLICKVLADAVEAAKGLDQDKLADWLRPHPQDGDDSSR